MHFGLKNPAGWIVNCHNAFDDKKKFSKRKHTSRKKFIQEKNIDNKNIENTRIRLIEHSSITNKIA